MAAASSPSRCVWLCFFYAKSKETASIILETPQITSQGTKVLLIEDGREDGITAKRAEMLISRIKALGCVPSCVGLPVHAACTCDGSPD